MALCDSETPAKFKELINMCWVQDPKDRLELDYILSKLAELVFFLLLNFLFSQSNVLILSIGSRIS